MKKSIDQSQAKHVVELHADNVEKFFIDIYSLHPFATAELATLLKEYKVDESFATEILDAVKEAEKNAPPPSDYAIGKQ